MIVGDVESFLLGAVLLMRFVRGLADAPLLSFLFFILVGASRYCGHSPCTQFQV
jgi:hypothetical protein